MKETQFLTDLALLKEIDAPYHAITTAQIVMAVREMLQKSENKTDLRDWCLSDIMEEVTGSMP